MLKEREAVVQKFMMALDALVVIIAFFLTFFLRRHLHLFYNADLIPSARIIAEMNIPINDYLMLLFFIVPVWCIALNLNGIYKSLRTKTFLEVTWILIKSAAVATLGFGTVVFMFKLEFVSRVFFIMFVVVSSALLMTEKMLVFSIAHYARRQGYNYRRILVVGIGRRAVQFINKVKNHPEWGLRIVGILDYEVVHVGKEVEGIKVLGSFDDLQKILHNRVVDEVIFVVPRAVLNQIEKLIAICETEGVKSTIAVDLFDLRIAHSRMMEIDGVPFITMETTASEEWQLFIKRAFDVVASGLGLIALSPLFLAVAILIKMTSPGPIFYVQKRVGLNGRRFAFYKFRSMYEGAHEKLAELAAMNEMKGPIFKIKNDPRITPLGKFLRKSSIDELPQLFHVFMGKMSIVGPRPPLPREVAQYEPWQRRRLSMRPGITCIWQISGRNKIGFDEWMKMDLEYIDNWSLWLDFKILCKTIPVVLFGIGAY